jgi:hypothetical protein
MALPGRYDSHIHDTMTMIYPLICNAGNLSEIFHLPLRLFLISLYY